MRRLTWEGYNRETMATKTGSRLPPAANTTRHTILTTGKELIALASMPWYLLMLWVFGNVVSFLFTKAVNVIPKNRVLKTCEYVVGDGPGKGCWREKGVPGEWVGARRTEWKLHSKRILPRVSEIMKADTIFFYFQCLLFRKTKTDQNGKRKPVAELDNTRNGYSFWKQQWCFVSASKFFQNKSVTGFPKSLCSRSNWPCLLSVVGELGDTTRFGWHIPAPIQELCSWWECCKCHVFLQPS